MHEEPTGCTIYFQFISVINLYMFRAGLLLIISSYYSVYTAVQSVSWRWAKLCPKHVELKVNKHLYLCHPLVLSSPTAIGICYAVGRFLAGPEWNCKQPVNINAW